MYNLHMALHFFIISKNREVSWFTNLYHPIFKFHPERFEKLNVLIWCNFIFESVFFALYTLYNYDENYPLITHLKMFTREIFWGRFPVALK